MLEPLYKYLLRRICNLLIQKEAVATSRNSGSVHSDLFLCFCYLTKGSVIVSHVTSKKKVLKGEMIALSECTE